MVTLTTSTDSQASVRVTVYTTGSACMRCEVTKRHLRRRGITFDVIDLSLEVNAPAREFVTDDLGYSEAPVVVVDGERENHWSGFRPDLIDRLVKGVGR